MEAGFSSVAITPNLEDRDEPLRLGGFLPREYCTGVHDDLYVRGVYIEGNREDVETHILMLIADVIGIDKNLGIAVKRLIAQQLPIPVKNIMISATHTHHGPDFRGTFKVGGPLAIIQGFLFPEPQSSELINFGRKIIRCAKNAYNNKIKVSMGVKQGFIDESKRIMINRRAPFQPNKAQYPVSVIKFCYNEGDHEGDLYGAVVNYAVHGTVLPRYNTEITADYVGYLVKHLESKYPGCEGNFAYFNGPCGEINPLTSELADKMRKAGSMDGLTNDDIYDQRGTWEDAQRIGETIAETAISLIKSAECRISGTTKVKTWDKTINIPIKDYNYGSDFSQAFSRILFKIKKAAFLTLARIGVLKSSILLSADRLKDKVIEAYIQVIDLDGCIIYTIPGEFFLKLGNEIMEHSKKLIPTKKTFLIELANNSIGYLYTIDAFVEGGYESEFSMTPMAGRYLTMKIKKLIRRLSTS